MWIPFRHFFNFQVTNSNIQTHPTLNVYPQKVIKASIIYLLQNKAKLSSMCKYNIKRNVSLVKSKRK